MSPEDTWFFNWDGRVRKKSTLKPQQTDCLAMAVDALQCFCSCSTTYSCTHRVRPGTGAGYCQGHGPSLCPAVHVLIRCCPLKHRQLSHLSDRTVIQLREVISLKNKPASTHQLIPMACLSLLAKGCGTQVRKHPRSDSGEEKPWKQRGLQCSGHPFNYTAIPQCAWSVLIDFNTSLQITPPSFPTVPLQSLWRESGTPDKLLCLAFINSSARFRVYTGFLKRRTAKLLPLLLVF